MLATQWSKILEKLQTENVNKKPVEGEMEIYSMIQMFPENFTYRR